MSRFILFALLSLLSGLAAAERGVLVVGDSLSAGYGIRQDQSWPALLDARLQQRRYRHRVANASISGDTSANGRSRLPAHLERHRPSIVILALGANDGLRGLPIGALKDNLSAMIRASRRANARVVLVGMDMPPNYGPDYRREFRQAFAQTAASERAALVPFMLEGFATKREFFQADGIHPSAAAQPLILENVWPALEPLLGARR